MSRLVVKVGGAVAERLGGGACSSSRREQRGVRRPRRRPADQRRDGARRHPGRVRRRPARDDARRASRSSAPRSQAVNAALCAAIGERAVPLFGDEIGLRGDAGARSSASSASPIAVAARPRSCAALDAGMIPVVAPIAVGPLNVNADDAAAAIAVGLGADRLLFLTDVDGLILDGEVVDAHRRSPTRRASCTSAGGTLERPTDHCRKLGAADQPAAVRARRRRAVHRPRRARSTAARADPVARDGRWTSDVRPARRCSRRTRASRSPSSTARAAG